MDLGIPLKLTEDRSFKVPKVGRQSVSDVMRPHIITFISTFFKDYLATEPEDERPAPPLLIIIDDVHRMDGPSWETLLTLQEEGTRIAFVLLWRTDFNGTPLIIPECAQAVHDKEELHLNAQIELGSLTREELTALFLDDTLSTYYAQMREEIVHRTAEEEETKRSPRGKKSSSGREEHSVADELMDQYCVHEPIRDLDPAILDILEDKCDGNPLLCLEFVYNLIVNHFVELSEEEDTRRRLVPNVHFW